MCHPPAGAPAARLRSKSCQPVQGLFSAAVQPAVRQVAAVARALALAVPAAVSTSSSTGCGAQHAARTFATRAGQFPTMKGSIVRRARPHTVHCVTAWCWQQWTCRCESLFFICIFLHVFTCFIYCYKFFKITTTSINSKTITIFCCSQEGRTPTRLTTHNSAE